MAQTEKSTRKKATAKKRSASASKRKATPRKAKRTPALKPGTKIARTYKGETYQLRVTEHGFALGKQKFRSLTAAAKAVTGYASVSGVRFWLGATEKGGDA